MDLDLIVEATYKPLKSAKNLVQHRNYLCVSFYKGFLEIATIRGNLQCGEN